MKKIFVLSVLCICVSLFSFNLIYSQNNAKSGTIQSDIFYACEEDQIEIMFNEESQVRLRNGSLVDFKTDAISGVDQILEKLDWHTWHRISDVAEEIMDSWSVNGERNTGKPVYNMNNIYRLKIPKGEDIWKLSRELENLPGIYLARPVPLPVEPPTPPNYIPNQGYLNSAGSTPSGINAQYAWTQTGGTGAGVTICDLEYSWNYNHADITKAVGSQINPNPISDPFSNNNHGTAVIGELVADNNGWGTTGICYGAGLLTCGTFWSGSWNVPGAMTYAIANLSAGDIILLEQQWEYTTLSGDFIPIEWWLNYSPSAQTNNGVYAAIVNAISNGIHVIEAGGNGDVNTDLFTWYGNSGAIIVGAGTASAANDLQRITISYTGYWGSSYGSRFDLQGWGENVVTTGYSDLYSSEGVNYYYTSTFNGTSSASPIVAGALACAEGYYLANVSSTPPTPAYMRSHLATYGTPQVTPPSGNIGPRPDLYAAITNFPPPQQNYDWGDAPGPYPTLSINNGANHQINPTVFLGNVIDAEANGQPNPTATGDDITGSPDDEDGVTFNNVLRPGSVANITVVASVQGYLNAWVDFNGINIWSDIGEQIFTNYLLSPGVNNLTFLVPPTSLIGTTYARFRFCTQPGVVFLGYAPDGEVEDYQVFIDEPVQEEFDWGDAPDPNYPTVAGSNGANHWIDGVTYMGAMVDGEPDGQPEAFAQGDDQDIFYPPPNDDEDGVTFTSAIIQGQNATVDVVASKTGLLQAWMDFNINGTWEPSEQIFFDQTLNPGLNNLSFPVPASATTGFTFARFRFSLVGGLPPVGPAPDGEVEDYRVYIGIQTSDIPMDPDPFGAFVQNEISMALVPGISPGVPAVLLAAYNDHPYPGGPGLGVSISTNGGATWNPLQLQYPLNPLGVQYADMFDPTATADGNGNLYVAHISTDYDWTNGPESGLYVHKTTDGGITWATPVTIAYDAKPVSSPDPNYRFNDRCQIIADTDPASPFYNNIYITWIKDRGWNVGAPLGDIYFSYSTDGGITWSANVTINQTIHNMGNMPNPAVASDGTVYVCWMDYNVWTGGTGTIYLNVSTDGGVTWLGTDIFVATVNLPPLNLNGGTDVLAKGAAVIEVSPLNPQELYIVYAEQIAATGDEGDIFLISSTDGGNTWTIPVRVNDDGTFNDQVMPWMDVKPNGMIDIAWYDRRNDPLDLNWDVYFTASMDGGNSFIPNQQVNALAAPSPNTPSGLWMGEYLGLVVDNTHAYIGFTSSIMDINGDVFFSSLQNPAEDLDYGDAPDPFWPTLLANDGARHAIEQGFFLGAGVDTEPDGQPQGFALGDDNDGNDDEDGVAFTTALIPGQNASMDVSLTDPTGVGGLLDCWIDFDLNGVFDHPAEHLCGGISCSLFNGINSISFAVPASAVVGPVTFARFRLSRAGGLLPTGAAPDGEVEDYRVFIVNPGESKMHYPQLPDLTDTGIDVDMYWVPLADDFLCTETGPINEIVMWGSFADDILPELGAGSLTFQLTIYSDNPAGTVQPWSMPKNALWTAIINPGEYNVHQVTSDPEWWYDPATYWWQPANHNLVFRYNFFFSDPFIQQLDSIYWIEIVDLPRPPEEKDYTFGWKTSRIEDRWNDDACAYITNILPGTPWVFGWNPLKYPPTHPYEGTTLDLAFIIKSGSDIDFGDAPDPFWPTLLPNGARHTIEPGFFLGSGVDAEPNGQPQGFALGDDNDGNDDEDGITFNTPLVPGQPASVNVTWADPTGGGGFLDCWIDYNINGVFDHPVEHLCGGASCALTTGVNTINFTVPAAALAGPVTFARFRLSRNGGLVPSGLAPNGEVEDYRVFIVNPGNSKMHHPQLPDLTDTGIDVDMYWVPLADDFLCTETGPIDEIIMWGSFADDDLPDEGVGSLTFKVTIYSDNMAGTAQPWSMPKDSLWSDTIYPGEYTVQQLISEPEWWYDPATYWWQPANHNLVFKYHFFFDDPFIQRLDSIYWIEIIDLPRPPPDPEKDYTFGWKTSRIEDRWNDDACVYIFDPVAGLPWVLGWNNLTYPSAPGFPNPICPDHPYHGTTLDLAFIVKSGSDIDFGDANDPPYPTLLINNGARHLIDGATYLGAGVDPEPDGQPDPNALGDDNDGNDDEDGVTFEWPLAVGNPCKVKVNASVSNGFLNAWVDFDGNGTWADPGEQIFVDIPLVAGDNFLNFIVPAAVSPGLITYARFRFSTLAGLNYYSPAPDGEVEDYEVEIIESGDYKWVQYPDPNLPGLHAHDYVNVGGGVETIVLADDWLCNGGLVTDIHWWGNYELDINGQEIRGAGISHFHLSIHTQNGAVCLPLDPEAWGVDIPFVSIAEANTGITNIENCPIYLYEHILNIPFDQIPGTTYWVDITAISNDPNNPALWRWQESMRGYYPILCGAADKLDPIINPWSTIQWGSNPPYRYSDMAFIITSTEFEPMDFGDASDPSYPTYLVNDGARHIIDGTTFMGTSVDQEANGQPDPNALGDDNDGNDDEDGVVFTTALVQGQTANVDIVVSVNGYLNAWLDFNANGFWGDLSEQIATDIALTAGLNTITFNVPPTAAIGITYARFRFCTYTGLNYTGLATDGEVEDYEIAIEEVPNKWAQYPDITLPGLHAHNYEPPVNGAIILADDWICEGGWVTDLHWWGNYELDALNQEIRGAGISHFHLSIHTLDPTGCLPQDPEVWGVDVAFSSLIEYNSGLVNIEGCTIYLYEYVLDEPFPQIEGQQYWLDITAVCVDPLNPAHWRWQEAGRSQTPILCGAANKVLPSPGVWQPISWPNDFYSDMAFVITSGPAPLLDFGDADDPPYPTLVFNNGARHIIDGITYLGAGVDSEPDGQPHPNALGDDNDGNDDEDGVTINPLFSYLVPGGYIWYDYVASVDGILNVWIDWNANGFWGDAGEHVAVDVSSTGPPNPNNTLLIFIPANANVGNTYARFRFSSVGGLSYTGLAPDGEVEDHELTIEGDLDFGDAPDQAFPSYPTLLANNGARHVIDPTIFLGFSIDLEPDGQPDLTATGDDNDGNDDEDGVLIPPVLSHGSMNTITVIASANGYLNGWIDFNSSGDWLEADEHIFIDQAVSAGPNTLNIAIPATSVKGTTYARFRFCTVTGLSYVGQAQDGEVEDYQVEIGEPEKWIQLPDLTPTGIDVDATFDNILADDFLCITTGPITRIEIWGSWLYDYLPFGEDPGAVIFTLSIHEDIPADQSPTGYSMPGDLLWLHTYQPMEFMFEPFAFELMEGFYNPSTGFFLPFGDTQCWKYIFMLNEGEFVQEGTMDEPKVYWLDLQAQPLDPFPECRFGWKTTLDHWNDDAVWVQGIEPYLGPWNELIYPPLHPFVGESIDLAFAIYGLENPYVLVDLTALLEGPFNGTEMQTTLNSANLIPLNQPYASDPSAIWYYTGTESVTGIPNSDIVDWIMIDLRDATSAASATSATIVDQKAAFMKKDGRIVATDGSSLMKFYVSFANNPFAVVWHRTHLGILSANPLNMIGFGLYRYDFTTGAGQAYLNGQKDLGGGIYGMIGGDGQPDGTVDINDVINVWAPAAGTKGYLMGDYNMDTQVENKDKNDVWYLNNGSGTQVP